MLATRPRSHLNEVRNSPGLVAYWPLSEAAGTVVKDEGGTHSGSYVNSPTLGAPGPLSGSPRTSVTLNGTSQSAQIPTATAIHPPEPTSLMCWFKRSATQGANQFLVELGTGDSILWFPAGNQLNYAASGVATIFVRTATTTDQDWHQAIATKNGTDCVLYYDGAPAIGTFFGSGITPAVADIGIGAASGNASLWFPGSMAEVAIWNRLLTASEVNRLYRLGRGF